MQAPPHCHPTISISAEEGIDRESQYAHLYEQSSDGGCSAITVWQGSTENPEYKDIPSTPGFNGPNVFWNMFKENSRGIKSNISSSWQTLSSSINASASHFVHVSRNVFDHWISVCQWHLCILDLQKKEHITLHFSPQWARNGWLFGLNLGADSNLWQRHSACLYSQSGTF